MAMTRDQVADWMRGRGVAENVIADEADYLATQYADPDEDLTAVLEGSLDSYLTRSRSGGDRANGGYNTNEDDAEYPNDEDGAGNGGGDGGYDRGPSGQQVTDAQLQEMLNAIQSSAPPDVDLSGMQPGDFPVFEVPGAELGTDIDETLLAGMQGEHAPLKDQIEAALAGLISPQGRDARLNARIESARERMTRSREASLEQIRADLANRGLLSEGNVTQGVETDATIRGLQPILRDFAIETREAVTEESALQDAHDTQNLSLAMGWSRDQAASMLASAQTAQEREAMKANIALQVLDRNIAWNKFLAEFGLQREQIEAEIRQGNQQQVAMMLQLFLQWANGMRGGYV